MERVPQNQKQHDNLVKILAEEYKSKGYEVEADINKFSQPETINGKRPDIIAKKGGNTTVVEVETRDSVGSAKDKTQNDIFKKWAKRSPNRHYKRRITK